MKALIVLEYRFIRDKEGNIWCERVVDYDYLKRYLDVFDEIVVAARTKYEENINSDDLLLVSGERVSFIELPNFKGPKGLIKNYFKMRKILKNNLDKFNCVIMRGPNLISLSTYNIFVKNRVPLAIECVIAGDKLIDGNSFSKKIVNKIIVKESKKMFMKANGVSYVTEKILQKEYPCKAIKLKEKKDSYFTATYSSIDLDEKDYFKQNWNINKKPDKIRIIHTGYMDSYRKGQVTLIRAAKKIIDKGYNIEVVLIGDGAKKEEFEKLSKELEIEDKVIFKGIIKEKQKILQELRKSHILVFPTKSEGLPRTIIEAMSQGLPCISSPVDGIPELLDNYCMIDYNNIDGYAEQIIELINNWEKMIAIGNENFEKSKKYEKLKLQDKRKKFYSDLCHLAKNNKARSTKGED